MLLGVFSSLLLVVFCFFRLKSPQCTECESFQWKCWPLGVSYLMHLFNFFLSICISLSQLQLPRLPSTTWGIGVHGGQTHETQSNTEARDRRQPLYKSQTVVKDPSCSSHGDNTACLNFSPPPPGVDQLKNEKESRSLAGIRLFILNLGEKLLVCKKRSFKQLKVHAQPSKSLIKILQMSAQLTVPLVGRPECPTARLSLRVTSSRNH